MRPQAGRTTRRISVDGRTPTRQVDPRAQRLDGRRPEGARRSARQSDSADARLSERQSGYRDGRQANYRSEGRSRQYVEDDARITYRGARSSDGARSDSRPSDAARSESHRSDAARSGARSTDAARSGSRRSDSASRSSRQQTPRRDVPQRSAGRRTYGRRSGSMQPGYVQPSINSGLPSQRDRFLFDFINRIPRVALIIAAVLIILIIVFAVRSCSSGGSDDTQNTQAQGTAPAAGAASNRVGDTSADVSASSSAGVSTETNTSADVAAAPASTRNTVASGPARVSFVAVGDNLPDDLIGYWADAQAGQKDDGTYDYRGLYKFIKPYVVNADLAYMKEETHLGGNEIGPKGYPSFNVTDEMADAVVDAGFDFVASASNHAYDWGLYGALENSLSVWEKQPVAFTGTSVTEQQYNRIATQEREGITFALLDYTYGVNWPDDMELPEHSINFIDEDRISADVARAKQQADVVLVAMHWGTELLMEADEQQQHLAQFLADLDVDVVLGSHPHVIGPVEWVKNSKGSGHQTLVVYSLGNFLSDHEARSPEVELEGMLCCDFVRDASSSDITIENARWVPLVNHTNADRSDFAVYALKDYTNTLAKQNQAYADYNVDDPVTWLRDKTKEVVGDVIPIDDGQKIIVLKQDADSALSTGAGTAAIAANAAANVANSTTVTKTAKTV